MCPVLVLLDEFAQFGKVDMITDAMTILRSKNVRLLLVLQSFAQLDAIYGRDERRIICDNASFKVILGANDPETQRDLAAMFGTGSFLQHSIAEQRDTHGDITGYSRQISETESFRVQPHDLSALHDVLLVTPYGNFRVDKLQPDDKFAEKLLKREMKQQ